MSEPGLNIGDGTQSADSFVSVTEQPILLALSLSMSIIGIVGNTLVLFLFYMDRKQLYIAHYFIVSMAVSDLLEASIGAPLTAFFRLFLTIDDSLCPIVHGIKVGIYLSCLLSVVLTAIDRYWSIVHTVHYRNYATKTVAKVMLFMCWSVSIIFGILVAFIRHPKPIKAGKPCYMQRLVHPIVLRSIFWGVIPLSLLVTVMAYIKIYYRIVGMITFKQQHGGSNIKAFCTIMRAKYSRSEIGYQRSRRLKEIRTTILMFITVFFFVLCWFPGIIALLLLVVNKRIVTSYMRTGVFMLYSLNSTLNPFLYAFHISQVRERLKTIWKRVTCRTDERNVLLGSGIIRPMPKHSGSSKMCFNEFELQFM